MTFIKRLLRRKDKRAIEPMHGGLVAHDANTVDRESRAMRSRMEAEVAGDRERRGATDERPVDTAR